MNNSTRIYEDLLGDRRPGSGGGYHIVKFLYGDNLRKSYLLWLASCHNFGLANYCGGTVSTLQSLLQLKLSSTRFKLIIFNSSMLLRQRKPKFENK